MADTILYSIVAVRLDSRVCVLLHRLQQLMALWTLAWGVILGDPSGSQLLTVDCWGSVPPMGVYRFNTHVPWQDPLTPVSSLVPWLGAEVD